MKNNDDVKRKQVLVEDEFGNLNLRELLKQDFGMDFPITGGTGNSIDNPIVFERTDSNYDYVGYEYSILKCLGIGRRITWKVISQSLLCHNGKDIDKVKIETKETTATQIITQIENFYFDVTQCIGRALE
jgi:hypothetical protein